GSGVAEDIKTFSVGLHQAVLDSVVDHLHKMAGAGGSAIEITLLGRATKLLPAGRVRNIANAGSQRLENEIKMRDRLFGPANHHAVTAFQAPDTAAGADINVVNAALAQFLRAAHVIFVIGVAAVNDDVAGLEALRQSIDGLL